MHSGWGIVVAVAAEGEAIEVLDRMRIEVADPKMPGAKQPYHYAAELPAGKAQAHIERCEDASGEMARAAVDELIRSSRGGGYHIAGCGMLTGAGRELPSLEKILAAHPLIHTAEGEFFREVVRRACEAVEIPVVKIPEKQLEEQARTALGKSHAAIARAIERMGATIGPPWTQDQKKAALAAAVILARGRAMGKSS